MKMCLGSGRARTALRNAAGQCVQDVISAQNLEKGKGKGKEKSDHLHDPLGRKPPAPGGTVPPTVNEKKPQVVPPRGPPGAGDGQPPAQEIPPSEDMIKALKAPPECHVCGGFLQV